MYRMLLQGMRSQTVRHIGGASSLQQTARTCRVLPAVSSSRSYRSSTVCLALSAEDKWQIYELCHKFDAALNRHDNDSLSKMFIEGGEMVTPKGSFKGKEALAKYFVAVQPMAAGNRHLTSNIVVEEGSTDDVATATSYRILHKASSPPALLATGTIEDEVTKEDGAWKFSRRKFAMDPPVAQN